MPVIAPNLGIIIPGSVSLDLPDLWAYTIVDTDDVSARSLNINGSTDAVLRSNVDLQSLDATFPDLLWSAGAFNRSYECFSDTSTPAKTQPGALAFRFPVDDGNFDETLGVWDVQGDAVYYRTVDVFPGGRILGQPIWDRLANKLVWFEATRVNGEPPTVTVEMHEANADLTGHVTLGSASIPGGEFSSGVDEVVWNKSGASIRAGIGTTHAFCSVEMDLYDGGLLDTEEWAFWFRFSRAGTFDRSAKPVDISHQYRGYKASPTNRNSEPVGASRPRNATPDSDDGSMSEWDSDNEDVSDFGGETRVWPFDNGFPASSTLEHWLTHTVLGNSASSYDAPSSKFIAHSILGPEPTSPDHSWSGGYTHVGLAKDLA